MIPAAVSLATLAAMSSTSMTNRFQPPGAGWRPSGIGRAAELVGPLSHSVRSSRPTRAKAAPICSIELEAELAA